MKVLVLTPDHNTAYSTLESAMAAWQLGAVFLDINSERVSIKDVDDLIETYHRVYIAWSTDGTTELVLERDYNIYCVELKGELSDEYVKVLSPTQDAAERAVKCLVSTYLKVHIECELRVARQGLFKFATINVLEDGTIISYIKH